MKLVNPVGRDLTELETEAYSCHCICSSGQVNAKTDGHNGGYDGCECDWWYHDANSNEADEYGIRRHN
ncbi:CA_C0660 family putative sactipeptide bacteriocin [Clostridium felsineum]|uniref:CA_C0660 family putative sactipeptide bacteriocin n=1 Tax=Clostridium felsineum TaxID=36839 RepID=UPI00098C4C71|nr:CA_C0660 family putative sactipeptide bacteriocin [Clostridium felsineum]URZ17655.1 hypothetical protein CLFE_037090 [Clostridium felsineum DSM 794]